MKKSMTYLLVYLGAEPREMNHLLGCYECDLEADIESMEIVRCPRNPQRIYQEQESEAWSVAWALCRFAGTANPRSGISMDAVTRMAQQYMKPLQEQLAHSNTLFERLRQRKP